MVSAVLSSCFASGPGMTKLMAAVKQPLHSIYPSVPGKVFAFFQFCIAWPAAAEYGYIYQDF
jgi:hypothetical protein